MNFKLSKLLFPVFLLSLSNICAGANDSEKLEEPGDAMGIESSTLGPAKNVARLVHGNCIGQFNGFIQSEPPRVFAYSTNEGSRQVCGIHVGNTIKIAREKALQRCNRLIKKKNGKALLGECRIVAEGDKQLLGLADFGIDENAAYKRALFVGNLRGVKHFIKQGASIDTMSAEGSTPLFIAAGHGDETFFFELVEKGLGIEHKLNDNTTLLFAAIKGHSPTIIRYLVDEGADVNYLPDEGYRPLHFAFGILNPYMVEVMMELGADPALKTTEGVSGYDMAETWGIDLDSLKKLDLEKIVDEDCTVAKDAAKYGDLFRLEQLAKENFDFNFVCATGLQLALGWADDNPKVIDLLIASGANVNTQDSYGESPLMTAARQGYLANVKALLSHGADKSLKNDDGKTAYDRISSLDEEEFKALLAP